ncbi:MAG: Coenzyme F420 hydrogenase/dehydrogenase, beta subunit C-terminal domain [Candidatus Peribacteraceae bacterium]|nr:Coenzyme F420 hydrogenase/dehydrogenase, beta subunit C-terminal domain [Candidatus Peribacteraceae bacterium]
MKPAIDVIGNKRCSGCFGCYNSCQFDAIEIKLNEHGFYMPRIDKNKCTECGNCQKYCPVITVQNDNSRDPKYYATKSNDIELQINSSSGGIFGELARDILGKGGVVFGAGWDTELNLFHKPIEKIDNLISIQGSKYIQSDMGKIYKDIILLAGKGKDILFCGTPCQVAALNTFFVGNAGLKEKITTCDLVCHGVASTLVFNKYLENIEDFYKSKIKEVYFRSKKTGWADFSMKIKMTNGKTYQKSHKFDPFMSGFLNDIYLRDSCYECPFSKIPRFGDITLGDLWGASKEVYDHYGVSIITVNNSNGQKKVDELVKASKIKFKEYPSDRANENNPRIVHGKLAIPPIRKDFMDNLQNRSFESLAKDYIDEKKFMLRLKKQIKYWRFRYIKNRVKRIWQ